MDNHKHPKVGVGVMVMKDGKILLGRRGGGASHADDIWCFPGGHLEHGESLTAGARRETLEEAGIEIENIRFICLYNSFDFLPKHFVCVGFSADWKSGDPRPEANGRMKDWAWFDLDALPDQLYVPNRVFIEAFKSGESFVDPVRV